MPMWCCKEFSGDAHGEHHTTGSCALAMQRKRSYWQCNAERESIWRMRKRFDWLNKSGMLRGGMRTCYFTSTTSWAINSNYEMSISLFSSSLIATAELLYHHHGLGRVAMIGSSWCWNRGRKYMSVCLHKNRLRQDRWISTALWT